MTGLALYALLTPALYYLGALAKITRPIWSRYPPRLDAFMSCAACSGFWYGGASAAVVGYGWGVPFLGIPGDSPLTPALVGLCAVIWTPIVAHWHVGALQSLTPDGDGES